MHVGQKLSIREIARLIEFLRNTVAKHLAASTIEFKFATPDRLGKLAQFSEKLAGWLKAEAGKSRKKRRTVKHGHTGINASIVLRRPSCDYASFRLADYLNCLDFIILVELGYFLSLRLVAKLCHISSASFASASSSSSL
jgi:hypothetical protein